jgi:excisionase family DNA binding protein
MDLDALPDDATITVRVGWLRSVLGRTSADPEPSVRLLTPLTVAEVAAQMGRATSTVRALLGSGALVGFKLAGEWRVRRSALEDFYAAAEAEHQGGDDPDLGDDVDLAAWRETAESRK